jgi:RimJ/RimL family protein N-acetyltransferase
MTGTDETAASSSTSVKVRRRTIDAEWAVGLAADPAIARSLSPDTVVHLTALVERRPPDERLLVAELDGTRIGAVRAVRRAPRHRITSLHALMLDPAVQGRGLGSATVAALVDHLVRREGEHRLEAEVYRFNVPSLRAFARAGFVEEGVRRRAYFRDGAWQEGVLLGLLAEDLGIEQDPPHENSPLRAAGR